MDQSSWVCYQLPNGTYYFGEVGYLDETGIVHEKQNNEAANNPKNKLVRHGFGIYLAGINPDSGENNRPEYVYEGYWDKNYKTGKGQLKNHKLGYFYEGNFLEDHYHGNGKMTWKNGDSYQGSFKRSKMDGAGTFKHRDGFILKGIFKVNYFIDDDILRNPQMTQKQYISFKKQRKQIIKQKQKQQKVKTGFVLKLNETQIQPLKQALNKSVLNNRVPLILSSKQAQGYNLSKFTQVLSQQFNTPVNVLDLRKSYILQGQQKWNYRQQIHANFRRSLENGEIFLISLDQSELNFNEMFYPDIKELYQPSGFNSFSWSRSQLSRPEIKSKIFADNSKQIHSNYKLIVWTKYKIDSSIKQDFLLQKLQTRLQKIIPFIKMDCILITEGQQFSQTQ